MAFSALPAAPPPTRPGRRRAFGLVLALGLAATGVAALSPAVPADAAVPSRSGWELVWSDDFNGAAGTGVNTDNWRYDVGYSYPGGPANWGTGEIQYHSSSTDNVYHDGSGNLAIRPARVRCKMEERPDRMHGLAGGNDQPSDEDWLHPDQGSHSACMLAESKQERSAFTRRLVAYVGHASCVAENRNLTMKSGSRSCDVDTDR